MRRKSEAADLTEWMDGVASAAGLMRIGLAHGSIAGFGAGGEASNPIAPDRAKRAGLDYLALGDWHRTMPVNPSTWYAGTPEADRFNSQELGQVLVVEIGAVGTEPKVTAHRTGTYRWLAISEQVNDAGDLERLERNLRALPDLSTTVMRLTITGSLPLAARAELERRLAGLEAALFHLETSLESLAIRPSLADLEAIDFGGALREAADSLKGMAEDGARSLAERRRAEDALVQLYLMTADKEAAE
jgi:DNA repair exonuclease SbcCD nuclease subunit